MAVPDDQQPIEMVVLDFDTGLLLQLVERQRWDVAGGAVALLVDWRTGRRPRFAYCVVATRLRYASYAAAVEALR